jgi:uncharacterized glyoxalase superfamily protein PhnB
MQSIHPVLVYDDAHAAMDFLERAFGLERLRVYEGDNGGVAHAELRLGNEVVGLSSTGEGNPLFNQVVGRTSVYVVTDDPDALHERARDAGAEIVLPLEDADYGSRGFTVRDPEGNLWAFGTYQPKLEG